MLANAWTYTPEDALAFYGTNAETGLTDEQVKRNKELYGENCKLGAAWWQCGFFASPTWGSIELTGL